MEVPGVYSHARWIELPHAVTVSVVVSLVCRTLLVESMVRPTQAFWKEPFMAVGSHPEGFLILLLQCSIPSGHTPMCPRTDVSPYLTET